jgi:pimeloyl-ACP methyl ester carboxylesterase
MKRVSVGDVELAVHDVGSGQPILFIHGFPLDHAMWDRQTERLSSRYRVLAVDLRGFGESGVTAGTVSMEQYADDLARLLDGLGVREPVVLCGLSMGGCIAWQFVRKYPDRVKALIACDTRVVADTAEAADGRFKTAEKALSSGAVVVADAMIPRLFSDQSRERQPAVVEATRQVILRTEPEGLAAGLRGLATRPDVSDQARRCALPTLAIVGEHDVISTADEMRGWASKMPNAEVVIVPGAGHMAPLENPQVVNDAIEKFLASLS